MAEDGVPGDEDLGAVVAQALEILKVDAAVDFDEGGQAPLLDPAAEARGSAHGRPR